MFDKLCIKIAAWVPHRIAYWVYIRVHNHAWMRMGNVTPDQVSCFDAMKHWRPE